MVQSPKDDDKKKVQETLEMTSVTYAYGIDGGSFAGVPYLALDKLNVSNFCMSIIPQQRHFKKKSISCGACPACFCSSAVCLLVSLIWQGRISISNKHPGDFWGGSVLGAHLEND
jgi:hypothetical protein